MFGLGRGINAGAGVMESRVDDLGKVSISISSVNISHLPTLAGGCPEGSPFKY